MDTQALVEQRAFARTLGYALGWFSIGLGVVEVLKARDLEKGIGAEGSKPVFKAYGVREMLTGAAILASREPNKLV